MAVGKFAARRTRAGRSFLLAAYSAVSFPLGIAVAQSAMPPWKPTRTVELVAVNAPGGGSDRIVRMMAAILQDRKMIEAPLTVVNKPGGGGSVAYAYIQQRPGDGHSVVLASRAILTNHIAGRGPSFTELTPLPLLFGEYIAVTVRPDSPIRDGRDLIERLKQDPGALTFGIATSMGNPNHQGIAAAAKAAGLDVKKLKTVIFPSGGAATTAMLGGHIDVVPISAAFAASMARSGQVRLVALAAPQRLAGVLAEVPTWREQGYDAVVSNWRSMIGPRGMTDAQIAYWEEVLRRLTETEEWKRELDSNYWTGDYRTSAETRRFMEQDNAVVRAFLTELGLAK